MKVSNERIEKRSNERFDVSIPIRCRALYGDSYLDKCTEISNLSKGGMRFECDSYITPARRLLVEMNLPTGITPIRAMVKVVWVSKQAGISLHEIGGKFLAITDEDELILSNFLASKIAHW